jgi:serine/threonine protein kinase/tetratricopeptide (TPR) repeat protein
MPSPTADRNLLFGILAVQLDFIGRDDLIAAMNAWVLEKAKPLGEILREQGKLVPERLQLLEALVAEHLKQHGNDPEKSLASLSSIGSLCVELQSLADPDVHATLSHVATLSQQVDVQATRPERRHPFEGQASSGGTRFRILRPHAKGGLGQVSVAMDQELNREVALKELQDHHADHQDFRSRFVQEAEITGGLEHPGIVPVYGLGHYADGRPFYAMRFIRGDSLKDAIDHFHQNRLTASRRPLRSDRPSDTGQVHEAITRDAASNEDAVACGSEDAVACGSEDAVASGSGLNAGERTLEFRKLLGRFIDVCNAVAYAHSRGVLHRDLKPGNIMLGKYGETLVVDWGLAKVVGRGDAARPVFDEATLRPSSGSGVMPTLAGSAIGTPAFMSPEQAAGRLDQLGPASDVYSLGATFYYLLTGQLPFTDSDLGLVLAKVQMGEFSRPRAVKGSVPAALEAICLKAMALEPQARYASLQALASDVERYLADEPVSCLAEPLVVRARRWMKRHRTLVAATAASVLVLVISLAGLLGLVATHNQTLAQKNTALAAANQAERTANELAQVNARQAQENATKADKNAAVAREQSQLALQSLEFVIFDIQRKLENVPGTGDLRRSLLQTAIDRLELVSDQFAARGAIDRNTAAALNDLGDVLLRIGTSSSPRPGAPGRGAGGASSDPAGPLTAARKAYQRAFDIAQKLAAADPTDARASRDLSLSYVRLGDVQRQSGQLTEALRSYEKGLEISQKLAAADPTNAQAPRDLCVSYNKLGDIQRQSGQLTEALRSYEKELEISQKLAAADPTNARAQCDLCVSHGMLGDVQRQSGQVIEALRSYEKGLEIIQKVAAADPTDARAQRDLSISYGRLGNVQLQSGQVTEALRSYEKELEISQKLAAADPTDAQAQRDLSVSYSSLGDVQRQSGQVTEALRSYEKFLELSQELAAADPADARAQRDLSVSYEKLGDLQLQSGQVTEPRQAYEKGLEIRQKLAAADPSDAQAQRDLWVTYYKLGEAERAGKQFEKAMAWYEKALAKVMQEDGRLAPQDKNVPRGLEGLIQQCRHAGIALGDWQTLLEQPADVLPVLLEMRGTESVQAGRAADAVQAIAKLRELGTATAEQLYNAACVYSLCAGRLGAAPSLLPAEQSAARQQHIADALATLREAIAAGWKDFAHMQEDPDLTPLRDLPEFKALLPTTTGKEEK